MNKRVIFALAAGLALAACESAPIGQMASGPSVTVSASDGAIRRAIDANVAQPRGYSVIENSPQRYVLQRQADRALVQDAVGAIDDPNPSVRLTYSFADVRDGTRITLTPAVVTFAGTARERVIPTPRHDDRARLQNELEGIRARAQG